MTADEARRMVSEMGLSEEVAHAAAAAPPISEELRRLLDGIATRRIPEPVRD